MIKHGSKHSFIDIRLVILHCLNTQFFVLIFFFEKQMTNHYFKQCFKQKCLRPAVKSTDANFFQLR